jgi:choline-sulfatase
MMRRPHLLLLMSDQHHPGMLGCTGDAHVATPWLDSIASAGVVLENCYCSHPLCVPSRMSFLTSRHSHQLQCWGNDDSLGSNTATLAHSLGIAGYRTVLCGRMHFVGGDQCHGFGERLLGDVSSGHLGHNRAEYRFRGFFGERESLDCPGPGPAHDLVYDQAVAAEACRLIRDHDESGDPRPLCLVVGFYSPHDPYRVYQRYYERYAAVDDPPADPLGEALHPLFRARREHSRYAAVSPENVRRARAAYRGKVTFLDDQIGMILESFRASRMADDSLTVYLSDHGEMLGEHGLWAKNTFHEAAVRTPCLLAGPRLLPAGRRFPSPMSLLDVVPTLLDAAGADPLPGQQGQSLWSALTGVDDAAWPEQVLAEVIAPGGAPGRMIRCGPWKLSCFPGQTLECQLFNLECDPGELCDGAADPANAALVQELRDRLHADGWAADGVIRVRHARRADYTYLARWTQAVNPKDPIQWGMAAPL